MLRYSVLFTVESLSLLYLLYITVPFLIILFIMYTGETDTFAGSDNPDEMLHKAVLHQDLHIAIDKNDL